MWGTVIQSSLYLLQLWKVIFCSCRPWHPLVGSGVLCLGGSWVYASGSKTLGACGPLWKDGNLHGPLATPTPLHTKNNREDWFVNCCFCGWLWVVRSLPPSVVCVEAFLEWVLLPETVESRLLCRESLTFQSRLCCGLCPLWWSMGERCLGKTLEVIKGDFFLRLHGPLWRMWPRQPVCGLWEPVV